MTAIKVEDLSKRYKIKHHKELSELFSSIVGRKVFRGRNSFWVLRGINLEIEEGDRLGILGRNGSGKSTLLKILARVTMPTSGRVLIRGRLAALLEIGTGFHMELTGRENIFLNASILGMTRRETIAKFGAIMEFSEIEHRFLDVPVKRYSTGMQARLAFSIASNIDRDIVIIDEVMAVGDTFFQEKSFTKMRELSREGKTIVLVNHDHNKIKELCNRAILLDEGRIIESGDCNSVVERYLRDYKPQE